jgi:hypothetical protein
VLFYLLFLSPHGPLLSLCCCSWPPPAVRDMQYWSALLDRASTSSKNFSLQRVFKKWGMQNERQTDVASQWSFVRAE